MHPGHQRGRLLSVADGREASWERSHGTLDAIALSLMCDVSVRFPVSWECPPG